MMSSPRFFLYIAIVLANFLCVTNAHSMDWCNKECSNCQIDSSDKSGTTLLSNSTFVCDNQPYPFTIGWSDSCTTPSGASYPSYGSCITVPNLIQSVLDTVTTVAVAVDMRKNFCSFGAGDKDIEGGIISASFLQKCPGVMGDLSNNQCIQNLLRGRKVDGSTFSSDDLDNVVTNRICDGIPNLHRPVMDPSGNFVFSSTGKQAYCPLMRCNIPTDHIKAKYYDKADYRTIIIAALATAVGGPVLGGVTALISELTGDCCDKVSIKEGGDSTGVAFLSAVRLKGIVDADQICTQMLFSMGWTTMACKMRTPPLMTLPPSDNCNIKLTSCADPSKLKSKTFFPFTSRMMQCVNEVIYNVFRSGECNGSINPIAKFQVYLRNIVKAMMILYVVLFGIKIALGGEVPQKKELFMFILKFAFVIYFAVGTFTPDDRAGAADIEQNGLEFLYKGVIAAMNSFSNMVLGNDITDKPLSLCTYNPSLYGQNGNLDYSFLAIWDALDCRVAFYLGFASPTELGKALAHSSALNILGGIFSYIWGAILSFNIIFLVFSVAFGVFLLSILIYLAHLYIIALIAVTIMIFMGPIFIPMALFEQTKQYFDSWLRLVLGFALQPAIIVAFIALMMSVFDGIVYNGCEFTTSSLSDGKPYWTIDDSSTKSGRCPKSFGFLLANLSSGNFMEEGAFGVSDNTSDPHGMFSDSYNSGNSNVKTFSDTLSIFSGQSVTPHKGLFTYNKIKRGIESSSDFADMIKSLMICTFFAFLFYYFARTLSGFAADVSGSAGLGAQAISPTAAVDAAMNFLSAKAKGGNATKGTGDKNGVNVSSAGNGSQIAQVSRPSNNTPKGKGP